MTCCSVKKGSTLFYFTLLCYPPYLSPSPYVGSKNITVTVCTAVILSICLCCRTCSLSLFLREKQKFKKVLGIIFVLVRDELTVIKVLSCIMRNFMMYILHLELFESLNKVNKKCL